MSQEDWYNERSTGGTFPALFIPPWFKLAIVVIDWLHCVDLGVLADLLGNVLFELFELAQEQPGTTIAKRTSALFEKIQEWYRATKPPSILDNLTPEMIRAAADKPPKLRAKGGEARYLLPIVYEMTAHWRDLNLDDVHKNTAGSAVKLLFELQLCVATDPYDHDRASSLCRRCCVLYCSLEQDALRSGDAARWRVKPKLHMLQEMIEYMPGAGSPKNYWCYVDESWVGFVSKIAHRRGGRCNASVAADKLLSGYRAGLA